MSPQAHAGFTLVELMVTLVVIGILAIVAVPSVSALISNGRVAGQTEELVASVQLARAEAVRRNTRVTLCPSTDGTTCAATATWAGWIVHGMDNTLATPADEVIRNNASSGAVVVSGPTAGLMFRPSGLIDSQQNIEVSKSDTKRCLTVLISGVVSVSKSACP